MLIGLVLCAGSLAACGSSGPSATSKMDPTRTVLAAYRATVGAKTATVTLTEATSSSSSGGSSASSTVTGSGAIDFSNNAFELRLNAPSGGTQQEIEIGAIAYVEVPAADLSQVPGQKPWISVNLSQVDQAKVGKTFSQLSSINSDDPTQLLARLQAVSDNVTIVGNEMVNGVSTTHYRATVDLNKEAALVRAKAGNKAAALVIQEEQVLGTHTLPVDVWVGTDLLVRQFRTRAPIPASSSGGPAGSGTATLTMSFSNFGAPVPVTPPPSSQVADVTEQVIQASG